MRRGDWIARFSHWNRGETRKRAESSRRSGIPCLGSLRRLEAYDCRRLDPARRDSVARVSRPALGLVVALMQTELRCPRCGDDLGLEDDLLDDGARIRLRCSGCGRWLRVECHRRLNVVDLGDYAEMRKGLRMR